MENKTNRNNRKWLRSGLALALVLVLMGGLGGALAESPACTSCNDQEEENTLGVDLEVLLAWASDLEQAILQPESAKADSLEEAFDWNDWDVDGEDAEESFTDEARYPYDVSRLSKVEIYALHCAYQEMDRLMEGQMAGGHSEHDPMLTQRLSELSELVTELENKMSTLDEQEDSFECGVEGLSQEEWQRYLSVEDGDYDRYTLDEQEASFECGVEGLSQEEWQSYLTEEEDEVDFFEHEELSENPGDWFENEDESYLNDLMEGWDEHADEASEDLAEDSLVITSAINNLDELRSKVEGLRVSMENSSLDQQTKYDLREQLDALMEWIGLLAAPTGETKQ